MAELDILKLLKSGEDLNEISGAMLSRTTDTLEAQARLAIQTRRARAVTTSHYWEFALSPAAYGLLGSFVKSTLNIRWPESGLANVTTAGNRMVDGGFSSWGEFGCTSSAATGGHHNAPNSVRDMNW